MHWPPSPKQLLIAAVSTTLSLVLCAWLWSLRDRGSTVQMVDNREAVQELFENRDANPAVEPTAPSSADALADANVQPEPTFRHWPLSADEASKMFASLGNKKNKRFILDPQTYFWVRPSEHRMMYFSEYPTKRMRVDTNAMGFRKDVEMRDPAPELRVLVTGDSHTEGVVANDELFTEVLEARLRAGQPKRSVEVLNAAKGGYSFYNYVGALEKFADLNPDLFIVTVYGGNDFVEAVRPRRFFEGMPHGQPVRPAWRKALGDASKAFTPLVSQFLYQVLNLHGNAENQAVAREAAKESVTEMARLCEARGIPFLLVYLPPAHDVQPNHVAPLVEAVHELIDLGPGAFELADSLAEDLLQHAETLGVPVLDLRPAFRATPEFLYWKKDHHINILGHRKVAEVLEPVVESLVRE